VIVLRSLLVEGLVLASWFVLGFYVLVNGVYVLVHLVALAELRVRVRENCWNPVLNRFASPFLPTVAVIVPAYDEAPTIVSSVQALADLKYGAKEPIVVNDGSTDATLEELIDAFDPREIDAAFPLETNSEPVRAVYRSAAVTGLVVIDKENGGKGDALNAGIWFCGASLFCALDADSLIDREGLLGAVEPFFEYPEGMVATGGTVRVVNGCEIEHGQVTRVGTSEGFLTGVQETEYLQAFYSGRLGFSRLRGLILISGAFGLFRTTSSGRSAATTPSRSPRTSISSSDCTAIWRGRPTLPRRVRPPADRLDTGPRRPENAGPPAPTLVSWPDRYLAGRAGHDRQSPLRSHRDVRPARLHAH
jgi:cellulose synthase/poly-beta-1,6-N-acetylglucosamine synthase-like glycosyltransferase